jgi:hypothetical protein
MQGILIEILRKIIFTKIVKMKTYDKQKTIDELQNELLNIETLYNSKCVNWKGKTNDTNEPYSEVIAAELLRNLKKFDNIQTITRTSTYCRENHCKIEMDVCNSNRKEEIFAKRLTGLTLNELGLIVDYQIPLKGTRADKGAGKIDLISFNHKTNTLYLIELKYKENSETLLRASLESYTYYNIIDRVNLLADYKDVLEKAFGDVDLKKIKTKPAVLLVPPCKANDDLEEIDMNDRPQQKALALAMGISYFTLEIYTYETEL